MDVVEQQIRLHGPNGPLPRNLQRPRNPQEFEWDNGDGVSITVLSKSQWHVITWSMLQDAIRGLQLYLKDGREEWSVEFRFWAAADRSWRAQGQIDMSKVFA